MSRDEIFLNIGSPVKSFVKSFLGELKDGLKEEGFVMCSEEESHTKMELNAIALSEKKGEGEAKIMGIGGSFGGGKSKTQSHKITVYAKRNTKREKEREKAEIEKSKTEQRFATQIALK